MLEKGLEEEQEMKKLLKKRKYEGKTDEEIVGSNLMVEKVRRSQKEEKKGVQQAQKTVKMVRTSHQLQHLRRRPAS